jgi:hypothetical protein
MSSPALISSWDAGISEAAPISSTVLISWDGVGLLSPLSPRANKPHALDINDSESESKTGQSCV